MSDENDYFEFHTVDGDHRPARDNFGRFVAIAVTIKDHGVWRVHKSDPDKMFPSDFHADRVDQPEKLDLYTGRVYSAKTNEFLRQLKDKEMVRIYNKLEEGPSYISERLTQREKFSYLS